MEAVDPQFALFKEHNEGPIFEQWCDDLQEAKRIAQELADREGFPLIVFNFRTLVQVGRFKPRKKRDAA